MRLQWNRLALHEFNRAFTELSVVSPQAAVDWQADVQRMMEMLENYPQIGPLYRRDADGEIRQTVVGRCRFIYRFNGKRLEMRRVWHVRRDHNPQVIREGTPRGWPAFVGY